MEKSMQLDYGFSTSKSNEYFNDENINWPLHSFISYKSRTKTVHLNK